MTSISAGRSDNGEPQPYRHGACRSGAGSQGESGRAAYFLRKRSNLTTSAPAGRSSFSFGSPVFAAASAGAGPGADAAGAGNLAPLGAPRRGFAAGSASSEGAATGSSGRSPSSLGAISNSSPNFTDGSKNPL